MKIVFNSHQKNLKNTECRGFTLIEIMLVVIIIAALAAMVVTRMSGRSEQAKKAIAQTDIDSHISTALKLYELDNGNFPSTAQGLDALIKEPKTAPTPNNWNGPYLEKKPIDPWGTPYVYKSPGDHRRDYDLSSKAKDANSDEDDIINWE